MGGGEWDGADGRTVFPAIAGAVLFDVAPWPWGALALAVLAPHHGYNSCALTGLIWKFSEICFRLYPGEPGGHGSVRAENPHSQKAHGAHGGAPSQVQLCSCAPTGLIWFFP